MTTTYNKSANEIAALFFARQPQGGHITAKQAAWLYSQASREGNASMEHGRKRAQGMLAGQRWTLVFEHNGAGVLKLW